MTRIAIMEGSAGLAHYFEHYLDGIQYEIFPVWEDPRFPDVEDFDAFILTGDYAYISDGLLPYHEMQMDLIRSAGDRKVFGSCFAHQLIAEMYGGKTARREKRFFGWTKLTITEEHPVFDGLSEPYFISLNGDEVTEKPAEAVVMATHEDCKYLVLRYGDNIITCQPHPEIRTQNALEGIREHKDLLMDKCPDLDDIVDRTIGFADDRYSDIFMENVVKWLCS
jgi:GMP synthase-like glutamine amidotransferase